MLAKALAFGRNSQGKSKLLYLFTSQSTKFLLVWELRRFLTSMLSQRCIFKDFKIYFIWYLSCFG